MQCPYCGHDGQPSVSGPYLHPMVLGLAHIVCSGCDRYLSSIAAPMPDGTVVPMRHATLGEGATDSGVLLDEAA